ncbi:hypothetical protein SERLA73DRAFT_178423 [Serpula lacrymans var. lacrymans S7.3]|uniref:Cytochrome P450 n=1 Tax=Serpula lacrymans var. lacrymans (strain S7.3) TaxID=936435 RepID=F8PRG2_SERL3|nr:hypothetical protein SERLA73DRAFT_178423 [Serpula lacrymans var. lacrymans S7.3]
MANHQWVKTRLTFSGGVTSCIGWRFADVEIQVFLVELVYNFEFSRWDTRKNIR